MIDNLNTCCSIIQCILIIRYIYYKNKIDKLMSLDELDKKAGEAVRNLNTEEMIYLRKYIDNGLKLMNKQRDNMQLLIINSILLFITGLIILRRNL